MQVQPYLFFNGCCDEVIAFYQQALNAEVILLMRFKDAPPGAGGTPDPAMADKVMHATVRVGDSHVLMSDGGACSEHKAHAGFSLSLATDDVAAGQRSFNALAEGGNVTMPFQATFWSPGFGMLVDRFGVAWMVNVQQNPA